MIRTSAPHSLSHFLTKFGSVLHSKHIITQKCQQSVFGTSGLSRTHRFQSRPISYRRTWMITTKTSTKATWYSGLGNQFVFTRFLYKKRAELKQKIYKIRWNGKTAGCAMLSISVFWKRSFINYYKLAENIYYWFQCRNAISLTEVTNMQIQFYTMKLSYNFDVFYFISTHS